jgi:glycosyltransferase involved in cell wall biosynthesis
VAKAMYKLELLERFYTSSYITSDWLQKSLEKRGDNFWSRRYISGLPGNLVDSNWRFELPEIVLRKLQGKSPAVQKAVYRRDVQFDKYVSNQISKRYFGNSTGKDIFWGFQGSCHASLAAANRAGMDNVCELATAHVVAAKRILGEEAHLHPEWAGSIDNLVFPPGYEKRLEEEPHLAKRVIAASSFTRETLLEAGVHSEKISVLPLGFDPTAIPYKESSRKEFESRPLKLLYAGTVTQRKGIKYLLEAMRELKAGKDVELHIIGGVHGQEEPLKQYQGLFTYHSAVSQSELFKTFGEYDALVLPTIFEGFGLVIVEAMAAGLPVITTSHSMGPEVITQGKNGYIVPIRDIGAIANAIKLLREKSNSDFQEMRIGARNAALNFSWENYTLRLKNILTDFC